MLTWHRVGIGWRQIDFWFTIQLLGAIPLLVVRLTFARIGHQIRQRLAELLIDDPRRLSGALLLLTIVATLRRNLLVLAIGHLLNVDLRLQLVRRNLGRCYSEAILAFLELLQVDRRRLHLSQLRLRPQQGSL